MTLSSGAYSRARFVERLMGRIFSASCICILRRPLREARESPLDGPRDGGSCGGPGVIARLPLLLVDGITAARRRLG